MTSAAADSSKAAFERVWSAVESGARAILIDSPPGAGKSTLVREVCLRYSQLDQVPIVVQTNDQADDMVRGFLNSADPRAQSIVVGRLHSSKYVPPPDIAGDPKVVFSSSIDNLRDCDIVVAPAAKWAHVDVRNQWSFGIIDEAYQMRSDQLLPVGTMMSRLLLVGDPGQIFPFTHADATRFRGRPLSPIESAATTVLTTQPDVVRIALPVSWRLPSSAASVIGNAFYRLPFSSGTGPGERRMELGASHGKVASTVRTACQTGWAYFELDDLIIPTNDDEAVEALANLVNDLLAANITIHDEHGSRKLQPKDVAIGVTHKDQRDYVSVAVARVLAAHGHPDDAVTVATANVLQGREFEVVLVWHPLSGRRDASSFHLDAGRLCVLLSRHRHACFVVSRGGVRQQLQQYPCTDPVWLGENAPVMDGWHAHLSILDHLEMHRA